LWRLLIWSPESIKQSLLQRQHSCRLRAAIIHFGVNMQRQYAGTLRFFKHSDRPYAGFGFISRDDANVDDFVHVSAFDEAGIKTDALENGVTRIHYDLIEDKKKKKMKAINLKLAAMEW
jgi:cold shock CspA family protein